MVYRLMMAQTVEGMYLDLNKFISDTHPLSLSFSQHHASEQEEASA